MPVTFQIIDGNFVISSRDGNGVTNWPTDKIHILCGLSDGKPLRLVNGSNHETYLEPDISVNTSWLASQCPNFYANHEEKKGSKLKGVFKFAVIIAALYFVFTTVSFSTLETKIVRPILTLISGTVPIENKTEREICEESIKKANGNFRWNYAVSAQDYFKEAKRRKYTVAQCVKYFEGPSHSQPEQSLVNGLTRTPQARSKTLIVPASPTEHEAIARCQAAFNHNIPERWRPSYPTPMNPYATEARRLGFTPQDCADIVHFMTESTSQWPIAEGSDRDVCNSAMRLRGDLYIWESQPRYIVDVLTAKSRGLTIDRCRKLVKK